MSKLNAGLPQSPSASAMLDILDLMASGEPPAVRWQYPIQPEPLRRARVDRGRGHLTDADVAYRQTLQTLWRRLLKQPLTGELFVAMAFAGCATTGTRRTPRPDRTNLEKAIEDAGNGILWRDDKQIVQGFGSIMAWGPDVRPFVSLEVWELGT